MSTSAAPTSDTSPTSPASPAATTVAPRPGSPALRSDPARVLGAPAAFALTGRGHAPITFVGWRLAQALGEEIGHGWNAQVAIYLTVGGQLVVHDDCLPHSSDVPELAVVPDLAGARAYLERAAAADTDHLHQHADQTALRSAVTRWPFIDSAYTAVG